MEIAAATTNQRRRAALVRRRRMSISFSSPVGREGETPSLHQNPRRTGDHSTATARGLTHDHHHTLVTTRTSRGPRCPRPESNQRTRFRKPLLYPLSYGGVWLNQA